VKNALHVSQNLVIGKEKGGGGGQHSESHDEQLIPTVVGW